MSTLRPINVVLGTEYLAATEFRSKDGSFDVFLTRDQHDPSSCTLRLKLKIRLQQIKPGLPPLYGDANGKGFWIRPWSGAEWATFVRGAQAQAKMWNNRFWLNIRAKGQKPFSRPVDELLRPKGMSIARLAYLASRTGHVYVKR